MIYLKENCFDGLGLAFKKYKIVFIKGKAGCGKTTFAKQFAEAQRIRYEYIELDGVRPLSELILNKNFSKCKLLIIDNLDKLSGDDGKYQAVYEFVKSVKQFLKVLLLSRGELSKILTAFAVVGELETLDVDFKLSDYDVKSFFAEQGINADAKTASRVQKLSDNGVLQLKCLCGYLKKEAFAYTMRDRLKEDLRGYYDAEIFNRFDASDKRTICKLALFGRFDEKLAAAITGNEHITDALTKYMESGSFIIRDSNREYEFDGEYAEYFEKKAQNILSADEISLLYREVGGYYESVNCIHEALKCFYKINDFDKVASLLEENANMSVGAARFYRLREYYMGLPEDKVATSPALMCGLSILNSLDMRTEQSEYWYNRIDDLKNSSDKTSPQYKVALEKKCYLDVTLPHRKTYNFLTVMRNMYNLRFKSGITLQDVCITGTMPSVMNGGKDFCSWSNRAYLLRSLFGNMMESVFGKNGVGLSDLSVGESCYEKNALSDALVEITRGINRIEADGTVDMLFAGRGILAKIMLAKGQLDSALGMIASFKEYAKRNRGDYLLPNIDALYARLSLYSDDNYDSEAWLKNMEAGNMNTRNMMECYASLTMARIYIRDNENERAQIILERVLEYSELYDREYLTMEVLTLKAITQYRLNDIKWQETINKAYKRAKKYRFVRLFAIEGAAICELMQKADVERDEFYSAVMEATKRQTVLYPDYLVTKVQNSVPLTEGEKDVIKLLSCGMSNMQIADKLCLSVNTIKFHLKNIYIKFGVSSRGEAIKFAIDNRIIR